MDAAFLPSNGYRNFLNMDDEVERARKSETRQRTPGWTDEEEGGEAGEMEVEGHRHLAQPERLTVHRDLRSW